MERIIATTDLSANSRAGMRFAIRLAEARGAELIFLHVHQVLRASFWSDEEYAYYISRSKDAILKELPGYVRQVYRSAKVKPEKYGLAIYHHLDTVEGIQEYAASHEADYICISTHGAGVVRRLLGTTTGRLISRSLIPVLTIPSNYRVRPLNSVLYASDLKDYEQELAQVVAFARPLKAAVDLVHFTYPFEANVDAEIMEEIVEQKAGYKVRFRFLERRPEWTLLEDIRYVVETAKPSLLVLFTDQERSLFDKVFLASKTREYAFHPDVPLLSFNKRNERPHPEQVPERGRQHANPEATIKS